MILQGIPTPPPPPGPQFDPNLIFLQGGPPLVIMIVLAALLAATVILLPIVRAFARRLEGKGTGDVALKAEVDQLHARLGEMEALQHRVLELEERVDFTERLLAQTPERNRIGSPAEGSDR